MQFFRVVADRISRVFAHSAQCLNEAPRRFRSTSFYFQTMYNGFGPKLILNTAPLRAKNSQRYVAKVLGMGALMLLTTLNYTAADAHTATYGYVSGATPGTYTFWYGTYHTPLTLGSTTAPSLEGSINLICKNSANVTTYPSTTSAFTTPTTSHPPGLVDGMNNFIYTGTPAGTATTFPGIKNWEGVTFTGVGTPGDTCTFTFIPPSPSTTVWVPENSTVLTGNFTLPSALGATNDTVTGVLSSTGGTNVLNALTGDTLNGTAATTSNVIISLPTGVTVPAGLTFSTTTGFTSVAAGTAVGTYTFDYQICEKTNAANCKIATESITVVAPQLAVTKSAPSPTLSFGSNSTYTLTISNTGSGSATTAQVKDTLPAGLTFVSASGTNWTCNSLIICNFSGGTIAATTGTSTISVVVTALDTASATNVTNYASIDTTGGASAPNPGASCTPAASCASSASVVAAREPQLEPRVAHGRDLSASSAALGGPGVLRAQGRFRIQSRF